MKSRRPKSPWVARASWKTQKGESCWVIRDGHAKVTFSTSELNKVFEEFVAAKWQKRKKHEGF